ncbi:sigma-70 family RNA polymerase sigma factor [[Kitasatospora] papulosa]|uniref:sigma-70 family RNA polymerase sigma factor n=1 Tax=Streptomyces TaxID=1883 RepID=UPI0016885F1A|nr:MULTISPECIES: sigma-70 family RNA polymerase sigma factor [Streptomyces]MBD2835130.1 sigma-70 family RNA polymerase sigma factor [Streptomyces pratensis]MCX4417852.1 sigma-70 family RNA polymerase sigma factor [[Kitasatospora] papulosa]MCY1649351.1 sigma-70 family RNA polymerase sigma factor [Streptomyces sp. SL203]MCY1677063.1 sigma-70 family RNA polymerase sigma factor [Streptomyces sp. SL294]
MSEEVGDDGSQVPLDAGCLPLPLEFEALFVFNQAAFHDLALAVLGTNDAAERAVHRGFLEILNLWDKLKAESEDLQQEVWAIMRRTVISEELLSLRKQMAALDSGSGLYEALGNLPPRQFDVMVLRYIGGHSTKRIGWYMGVTASTVDYHCRQARKRLSPKYYRILQDTQEGTS